MLPSDWGYLTQKSLSPDEGMTGRGKWNAIPNQFDFVDRRDHWNRGDIHDLDIDFNPDLA